MHLVKGLYNVSTSQIDDFPYFCMNLFDFLQEIELHLNSGSLLKFCHKIELFYLDSSCLNLPIEL